MTTPDMLDERYGRTGSARRRWFLGTVITVASIAVGLFAWMTISSALDDVHVDATGFDVQDARTVEISFQVTAPPGRSVACVLEAQDEEHGVVGWRVIELAASDTLTQAFREAIPTTAQATTGLVGDCWVT